MAEPYVRDAVVVGWVDGDTVDLKVDLGWRIVIDIRVRLRSLRTGVDTPERGQAGYREARSRAEQLAPPGASCTLYSFELDKYGRTIGAVVCNGMDVGSWLLDEGRAKEWLG